MFGACSGMALDETQLAAIVSAGCPACHSKKLLVSAYVAQHVPLLEGELYGKTSWAYKGEDFVHGTYSIACAQCASTLYGSASCPLCNAEAGLARAFETENDFAFPLSCGRCDAKRITARAYVPITVRYEGTRTEKARTEVAPEDPGFHAFRAECMSCHEVSARHTPCPLCGTR